MDTGDSPIFWHFHEGSPWRRESICYPEMYDGGPILSFACTQLIGSRNYADQKKLVAKWCDTLPNLNEVQYVLFGSQMTQSLLDAVALMPQLKGLHIKWSSIQSVQPLVKLKNIEHLHIGSSTRISGISVLSELKSLITLDVENVPSMKDIGFVSSLTNLRELGIHGSNWTFQHIDRLAPLHSLRNLQTLTLWGTKVTDKNIRPIAELKSLRYFDTPLWYERSELEWLYTQLPNLTSGNLYEAIRNPNLWSK